MEYLTQSFTNGDIWIIIIKILITALLSSIVGYVCALIGKLISRNKKSKIRKYAEICVKAAEQKFPNEGKKMGPEKMQYVMDQLAIKFPKIKENTYLYNIVEAAVYELNRERRQKAAIEEFEQKYGEKPIAIQEQESIDKIEINESENPIIEPIEKDKKEEIEDNKSQNIKRESSIKLNSF